ncbi:MAG: amidohydrolase family protein [Chloroflexi bacterium]|nr:amidohydrolase family protein [Chloroflexota bacterium]
MLAVDEHLAQPADGHLVAQTDLPLSAPVPTHVNRSQPLLDEAIDFARTGGMVDVTATIAPSGGFVQAVDPLDAVLSLVDAGIAIEQVTVSSDAGGNMPLLDASGAQRLSSHPMGLLYDLLRRAFVDAREPGAVLSAMTRQPADRFGLPAKGRIGAGCDADIVLVDEGFGLHHVYARGRLMVDQDGPVIRGKFENH